VSALQRVGAPIGAVLLGALCFHLSTGLGTTWPLAWLAPVGVLAVAFARSWRMAAFVGFAAHFLGSLALVGYLGGLVPLPIVLGILAATSLTFAAAVLLARLAFLRLPPSVAVCAFPSAWTSIEFLTAQLSPHGTFLNLAYSQVDCLPLLQVASVTGLWGVSFLVTLVPSALAAAWVRRAPPVLVAPAVAVVLALGFGSSRLRTPPSGAPIRVGLAATDERVGVVFETRDPAVAGAAVRGYADRVARLASLGASVVVLPEKMVGITPESSPQVVAALGDAARDGRVTLVAGLNRVAIAPPRNVALVYGPDGSLQTEYDKRHMLPGPETGYLVGERPGLFDAHGARWGVAICKDMDFPPWSRAYGRAGVQVLAVPAWDFVVDGRLHSRMAVVRAVENGFALVRTAMEGRLLVTDAYGRVLAEDRTDGKPEALLVASVPPGPGTTFYARAGDWFGWLSVAALVALVAASLVRARSEPASPRRA
jgi:apolipoprotein N-acyltransferase